MIVIMIAKPPSSAIFDLRARVIIRISDIICGVAERPTARGARPTFSPDGSF